MEGRDNNKAKETLVWVGCFLVSVWVGVSGGGVVHQSQLRAH